MARIKVSLDAKKVYTKLNKMPRIIATAGDNSAKKVATFIRGQARRNAPSRTGHLKNQIKVFKKGKNIYQVLSGARVRSGKYSGFPYSNVIEHGRGAVDVYLPNSPELAAYLGRKQGFVHLDPYPAQKYMHRAFLSGRRRAKKLATVEVRKELKKERLL